MLHRLTNAFGKVYMTIYVDRGEKWIRSVREGFQSESNIKEGLAALTDAILMTGLSCVLADMTMVLGPISSSGWAAMEWAPQAASAGLKHMALVVNPESIASQNLESFHAVQAHIETRMFYNLWDAKEWLRQFC